MPPRHAYWTIIVDGMPTAFRAAERDELLPTFERIRQKNPGAELKWFAKGRLWESPEEARLGGTPRRVMTIAAATGVPAGSTRIRAIGSSRSRGTARVNTIAKPRTYAIAPIDRPTAGSSAARCTRSARVRIDRPDDHSASVTIAGRTMPEDHDPIAAPPVRAMRETINTRGPTGRARTGERGAIGRRREQQ